MTTRFYFAMTWGRTGGQERSLYLYRFTSRTARDRRCRESLYTIKPMLASHPAVRRGRKYFDGVNGKDWVKIKREECSPGWQESRQASRESIWEGGTWLPLNGTCS